MGATTNIKDLFFSKDITDRTCSQCSHYFTLKDYKMDNWDLEYKTNYSVDLDNFKTGTHKGKIGVLIELYHGACPQVEDRHPPRKDEVVGDEYPTGTNNDK